MLQRTWGVAVDDDVRKLSQVSPWRCVQWCTVKGDPRASMLLKERKAAQGRAGSKLGSGAKPELLRCESLELLRLASGYSLLDTQPWGQASSWS